jgi:hypothetical protein
MSEPTPKFKAGDTLSWQPPWRDDVRFVEVMKVHSTSDDSVVYFVLVDKFNSVHAYAYETELRLA